MADLAMPLPLPPAAPASQQTLTITSSRASAAQLQQLGAALRPPHGALREVSLGYRHYSFAEAASGGWPSLPLLSLDITSYEKHFIPYQHSEDRFTPGMLASLAQLTMLTSLRTSDASVAWHASSAEMARVLASLTSLQTLVVSGHLQMPAGQEADAGLDAELIGSAVCSLPHLKRLKIDLPCAPAMLAARPDIKHATYPLHWA